MADIDISLLGDKALERQLRKLPDVVQRKVVRGAFVKPAAMIRKSIRERVPGSGANHQLLKKGIKVKAGKAKRGNVSRFIVLPSRAELGIDPTAKHYWPAALEYGHGNVAPRSYMRAGFDVVEEAAFNLVKSEIGRRIVIEAAKL